MSKEEKEVISVSDSIKSKLDGSDLERFNDLESSLVNVEGGDVGGFEEALTVEQKKEITEFRSFDNLESVMQFSGLLFSSGITPFRDSNQVATIMLYGNELGLPPIVSLYNIYFIDNKPTLSVHAQNALLRINKISFRTLEDCVPINEFGKPIKDGETIASKRTTIEFARKDELFGTITEKVSYTLQDSARAGLNTKDVWKKYPRAMLYSRTFSTGARRIAGDILMGVMETSEMLDSTDTNYDLDDKNNIILNN